MMRLAVQLSSFHELLRSDLAGTLGKIADSGFPNVEVDSLYGESDTDFKSALVQAGMNVVSFHTRLNQLRSRFMENVDYAKLLGAKWLIVPVVELDEYGSGWKRLGSDIAEIALKLRGHGLELAYHPTLVEFRQDEGKTGLDHLYEGTSQAVDFEFDLALALKSGASASDWLAKLAGHVPLLVIDMGPDEAAESHPMMAAWKDTRIAATTSGVEWVVLQEKPGAGDRFEKLKALHRLFLDNGLMN